MRRFRQVKTTCFGLELHDDFEGAIARFSRAYADLDANITPKVHAVLDHILPFFMSVDNRRGLGYWSEQAAEAVYHDFNFLWCRSYKVLFFIQDSQSSS